MAHTGPEAAAAAGPPGVLAGDRRPSAGRHRAGASQHEGQQGRSSLGELTGRKGREEEEEEE